jgi:hypothetical protein
MGFTLLEQALLTNMRIQPHGRNLMDSLNPL